MSEQFPVNRQLADLVAQARAVPTPNVSVTAADIEAELGQRSWGRWSVAAVAAAAAVLLGFGLWGAGDDSRSVDDAPAVAAIEQARVGSPEAGAPTTVVPEEAPTQLTPAKPVAPSVTQPVAPAAKNLVAGLGEGVRFETVSGDEPVVVSKWDVTVAAGVYRIEVAASAASTLRVQTGRRVLNVEPGAIVVLDDGKSTVETGRATWADRRAKVPAAELASQAEAAMARGDKRAAMAALTTLVRSHPKSPHTRTGLVDLARLRAATGDKDRARCAYALVLKRWPNASTAPDVQRALGRLGDGPQCRGLVPKR